MPRRSTKKPSPGRTWYDHSQRPHSESCGVDFAAFSEHWRRVHGPLALRVEAMRAYRQNHSLARLPAREGDRLHRVDGISQLWFDNVESMRVAMESAEQRACIEDVREFLSDVTILIQQEGERRQHGDVDRLAGAENVMAAQGGSTPLCPPPRRRLPDGRSAPPARAATGRQDNHE